MRNLRNLGHWFQKNPNASPSRSTCAWDSAKNDIIIAYGPSKSDTLVSLHRWSWNSNGNGGTRTHISSWDALNPSPESSCDKILEIRYFSENLSTCLVFAGGDVVVVRESPLPGQERIEILGSVDVGIAAAAWSPDEELLVILTNTGTLLYMSREFEGITDINLQQDDLKASKHVSVGWGKAETQFRGKGAKALRDPTMPEKVDQGLKSSHDDGVSIMSWRGDGAYIAVNSSQKSDRRVIRVYSREGKLDGVTEPVDYLESALSWRPAGNLMAGVQRFPDRIDVVFFERNGLRHGQFSLRLNPKEMETEASAIELKWNQDSTILAACFSDRVQLWTMRNYHYYLKQEVLYEYKEPGGSIPFFCWHPEESLLFLIGHGDYVQRSEYGWRHANGTNIQPFDVGLTSVIDGKVLKITPLKSSNIPPPMSHLELEVANNILDVAYFDILTKQDSTIQIAILDNVNLSVYSWDPKQVPMIEPKLESFGVIKDFLQQNMLSSLYHPRQLGFVTQDRITILMDSNQFYGTMALDMNAQQLSSSTLIDENCVDHIRELLQCYEDATCTAVMWYSNGNIQKSLTAASSNGHLIDDSSENRTKIPSNLQAVLVKSSFQNEHITCNMTAFGLRKNGMLFANDHCIAKDCTSFLISEDHLIFTTSQHLLKFVHLPNSTNVQDLQIPPDTPEIDERCRAIERGAKLVNVVPSTSALILQMPRGNLETIYPRALILPVIRQHINKGNYKKAFLACRNHRVDMNIIHDHAPEKFVGNVGVFIDQIKKIESIDLFLSQLREEDVSTTMYKETSAQVNTSTISPSSIRKSNPNDAVIVSKVNRICFAFLEALKSRRSSNLQNIITAHVCQSPPALENGLFEISTLQKSSPKEVDSAVEHICFLADVNRLFDTALGMYDLDVTLLIAQQSQRDPREYLPFLQKLKEKEMLRMKVDIDNHLHRYDKVLVHLRDLNDFDTFKRHMIRHDLYKQSIEIFRYQEIFLNEIMQKYAEYLESRSRHRDAGIVYEYLKKYRSAAESYQLAYMWQEALSCATLIPFEADQLKTFATQMADSLVELKKYQPAATIQLEYLGNIEAATRLLCRGYHFAEAIRLLGLHLRSDLLDKIVDAGLGEGQAMMTEVLAEMKGQLNAQVPRIQELRIIKLEEPLAFYDADVNGGADIPDNVSLAGTDASTAGGTLFTRYTNRTGTVATNATKATSKKRIREERKRARGKKGSVYEEEYLINSVARLIERINTIGDEVERLVIGLMRRGMRERARAVENAMLDVVQLCKDVSLEVFQASAKEEVPTPIERPTGGDGVMWDSMEQIQTPKEAPLIKDFQRLSILGG